MSWQVNSDALPCWVSWNLQIDKILELFMEADHKRCSFWWTNKYTGLHVQLHVSSRLNKYLNNCVTCIHCTEYDTPSTEIVQRSLTCSFPFCFDVCSYKTLAKQNLFLLKTFTLEQSTVCYQKYFPVIFRSWHFIERNSFTHRFFLLN